MSYFNNDPQAALGIAKPSTGMMGQRHDLRMARDRLSFQTEKQNAERQSILSSMDFKNELENRSMDEFKNQDRFKNAMEDLGKARQFREWRNNGGGGGMKSSYADGGPVQGIEPKGFVPKAYADGGAVVSFRDLEPANVVGRKQISGSGMKEYNENYAFGTGTGRAKAPRDFRKAPRTLADGGPVQDVQAKGFVPVQVSNGEFEFTPEQVANIGAAMLASKEQVPA